VIISN